MPVLPFSRPLYQKALARQAIGVMSGLQAGMNQRGRPRAEGGYR